MQLKFQPLIKLAAAAALIAVLSACQLIPTPLSQPTSAPAPSATLPAAPTVLPGGATPVPTPSIEPTEDPTVSLVNLADVKDFFRLSMLDASSGWAVTGLGLLRTNDGGLHWHLANPPAMDPTANPLGSFFPDAKSAYLLTPGQDFSSGVLYHTTDTARTWTATNVPFSMGSLQFVDAQKGFFMASLGAGAGSNPVAVFETNDGGLTWQQLFSTMDQQAPREDALGNSGIKTGFTMLDAQHGWITGSVPVENFVYLYATSDGGLTWQHQDLPIVTGGVTSFYMTDPPVFLNASDGILQAQQSPSDSSPVKKAVFVTHDGGLTWSAVQPIDGSGPLSAPTPMDWFFWNQGKLIVTHDAGIKWEDVPTSIQLTESPGTLQFINPTTGWEIHYTPDSAIHFYTTTDAGQTWSPIIP